jgi:HEAT repeat protein
MRFPSLPDIDTFSFWLGFAAAALIVFLLWWFRKPLGAARQFIYDRLRGLRETLTSGTERALREDVIRYAQTAHLAGSLFALNEILIAPRVLAPAPPLDPTSPPEDEDLTAVIPVIPEWPDLAGVYRAPTLSVEEAFTGTDNIVILGGPGSGKTTLLAHLATRAGQGEALFPEGITPLFVHAADLDLPHKGDEAAGPLIAAAQARASALTAVRLSRHLGGRLREFKCAIFLDGLDELPPAQIAEVATWLAAFEKQYPQHRVIAAAGVWGYGPLTSIGFAPVLIAPWNGDDFRALIQKWGAAWQSIIRVRRKKATETGVDPHLVMGWLGNGNVGRSVFEVTLKVWAAFAGDARGNRPVDWLEAYVLRFGVKPTGQRALAKTAAAVLGKHDALGVARSELLPMLDPLFAGPPAGGKPLEHSDSFLDDLIRRHLLARHAKDRLCFEHSLAAAYCAATALAAESESVAPAQTPAWARALYFFAALGDLTPFVGKQLTQAADVLQTELLTCALWLRDAPPTAKWRGEVFRRLSQLMMNAALPESLRLRALAGFVASTDPNVVALFKQALANPDPFNRRMAALGLGALGDPNLVPQIAALFADPYLDVRWAAALALSAIATEPAIDALARGLMQADDNVRQACAQALARQPELGHPLLQEAIAVEDLAARRAAVFGLADTHADWALKKLEEVQHNEQQWIVRNAAVEIVERWRKGPRFTPQPYQPPESQGWLIAWAAQRGTGVPPGRAAIDLLGRAMKEGDELWRRAAAESLGRLGDPTGSRDLYAALRDPAPLIRDAAFRALAQIAAASGQRMAAPVG